MSIISSSRLRTPAQRSTASHSEPSGPAVVSSPAGSARPSERIACASSFSPRLSDSSASMFFR